MKIINRLIKRLKSHTPEKWRKLGNTLVAITTGLTIPADLLFSKWIALIVFSLGVIGRCLIEFTTDEPA
jgi:hypothetical protein